MLWAEQQSNRWLVLAEITAACELCRLLFHMCYKAAVADERGEAKPLPLFVWQPSMEGCLTVVQLQAVAPLSRLLSKTAVNGCTDPASMST